MTTRTRTVALTMAALMLASSLVITAPAAIAQDSVPTRPGVVFEPIPNLRQFLYATYNDVNDDKPDDGAPDCRGQDAQKLRLRPADEGGRIRTRGECAYAAGGGVEGLPSAVDFVTTPSVQPNRRVTFTGNFTSFAYHHEGMVSDGVTLTITVKSDQQTVATGTLIGDSANDSFDVPLTLAGPTAHTGRVALTANRSVTLSITSTGPGAAVDQLPGGVGSWTIDDTNTYLELRADDAVRAAMWITDEKSELRNVFAPIANESLLPADRNRRIVGHFALQSAFGADDARGSPPEFSILRDGNSVEIGAGGRSVLTGVENTSASVYTDGVVVWSFPAETINYRGFPAGAYVLHAEKTHHQGAPINRQTDKLFSITSQSVALAPYSDERAGLLETQAHAVQAGGSTTYVLAVNNTGAVNDTFSINLSAPNAPSGWGGSVGGPDVQGGRIFVPAGETRVFTVTVTAPFQASGEVIHLVNVTSVLDPGARSRDLTLVTSIRDDLTRELGIIVLQRDLTLEPGLEARIPVYVWNRGTRVANVSLEIQETSRAGWVADLALGNLDVDRIVLSSIPPGGLAEATLQMTGPLSAAIPSHTITLNASMVDSAGISTDRALSFTLRTVSGVTVTALNTVGARSHLIELSGPVNVTVQDPTGGPSTPVPNRRCDLDDGPDCTNDGLHGTWFRLWVTNTGRAQEQFDLTADTFRTNCDPVREDDRAPNFPVGGLGGDFSFYTRSPGGVPSKTSAITLMPGTTGEVYVFVPVTKDTITCKSDGTDETFSFVAQARGRQFGAIGRASLDAAARNSDGPSGHRNGVYLEGVVRESGYSNEQPIVDIDNATKRTIIGATPPGENLTYYVRMTNAASWSEYTDENGRRVAPDLKVSLVGVKYEEGWNVSIRPVLDSGVNDIIRNPHHAEYNLSNVHHFANFPHSRQGWFDRELEVVVQPPSIENASLAGLRHEFQIIAETNTTSDKSTLGIVTVIEELANITVQPSATRIFAHPGEPGAFLLLVSNNGSSTADVTLSAEMNADNTPNAGAWQVNPNAQRFPLPAFKNRTIALLVTPPVGSTQGATGELVVTLEYPRSPSLPNVTTNVTRRLVTEVVAPGTLQLTPAATEATIGPSGTANFTMMLRNSGSLATTFRVDATPIPNWTVTASPDRGTLNPGESRPVVLVMIAPADVTNDTRFASVVTVREDGNTQNFDSVAFTANILGGKALPKLSVPNLAKRVDRAGVQHFEVQVQNVGTAAGRLALEVRSQDPTWIVGVEDTRGVNITGVQLGPNELVNVNVSVRAPFSVPERTAVPVEIIAYSPDATQSAKATLSAEIHDYGVQLTLLPSSKDVLPGLTSEFTVRLRNTGNDNDTLNVSANLIDLPEWSVQLSSEEVRLEPGQEQEVRATIRSPTGPLPAPRAYTFPFWVGTRGGQEVNITKNMTASAVVTVPNYRSYDVDGDGQLEIAVDLDKRATNGFEEFREVFNSGLVTQSVARGLFNNRTTFFLDVPAEGRPYDGVADIWFNPESVYGFEILHAPDINGDGTPDYLLDTDQDGKIDKAFDSATERFWDAYEVSVFGDTRIQYLIDMTGDGRPDRFFDPETGTVTRTQNADGVGADYVGIDVDDDERVDYYYNTRTRETSGAEVSNVGSFARDYWYFFLVFLALVALTAILIVRRRNAP